MMYSLTILALAAVSAFAAPVVESQSRSPVSEWTSFSDMNLWQATIPAVQAFLALPVYADAESANKDFKTEGQALIEDVNKFTRAGGEEAHLGWVSGWANNLNDLFVVSADRLTEEQKDQLAPLMKNIWVSLTTKIASRNVELSAIPTFILHGAPQTAIGYKQAAQGFMMKAGKLIAEREGSVRRDSIEDATTDIINQLNILEADAFYELQPAGFLVNNGI